MIPEAKGVITLCPRPMIILISINNQTVEDRAVVKVASENTKHATADNRVIQEKEYVS